MTMSRTGLATFAACLLAAVPAAGQEAVIKAPPKKKVATEAKPAQPKPTAPGAPLAAGVAAGAVAGGAATVAASGTNAAAAAPAAGSQIKREAFDQWALECFEPPVNGLKCQVAQKLVATDSKQLVLIASLAWAPKENQHLLQLALPLNFLLKPGVEIEIGSAKTTVQVDRCSSQGCFIEGIAAQDLVDAMRTGAEGNVKFLSSPDKRVVIPFSLKGFAPAYDKMKALNATS